MNWDQKQFFCHDLETSPKPNLGKILVTGATGYVGGRLVPELIARGYSVRVMVRAASPEYEERWPEAEIVVADALDLQSLIDALKGVYTAYYLIHSMVLGPRSSKFIDIRAAINFKKASEKCQIRRIIYLGGMGEIQRALPSTLIRREMVIEALKRGNTPVTLLRAAIIIGSGSASYEILKHLVSKIPVLLLPRWSKIKCRPISVRDVIKYLVGALEIHEASGKSFNIVGTDILNFEQMLRILAKCLGKKRLFVSFPTSNVNIFAYLSSLITPVPAPITMGLFQNIAFETAYRNGDISQFLDFNPIGYKETVLRAMTREEQDNIHTRWSDAYPPAHELAIKLHELDEPAQFTSSYSLLTTKDSSALFKSISSVGGREGWFQSNWLWRLRGAFDRILFGVGTSRGRKSSTSLQSNDVIDFWRVEDYRPDKILLLRAEMKLPGRAWLKFKIDNIGNKRRLTVKAYYQTRTLFGKIYWFSFLPFHIFIFQNLLKQIEKRS